jgi:ketosteroid isomerase-like protein
MSQENVEIVRVLYDAFNRGELDAYLSVLDPEFVWHGPTEIPDLAGTYRGVEGVRRYLSKLMEVFNDYRMVPEEFIDAGDEHVLVLAREGGRGKGSGIAVQTNPTGHLWTVRDGRPARLDSYWERANALQAVGLEQ